MQTRSRSRAVATPRRPQSVAALLPEEILDLVFAQFGFNYSLEALLEDQMERNSNLGSMSVTAEGWTKPARRLLVKSVKVRSWAHLQTRVPGWAGKQVRELDLHAAYWEGGDDPAAASAVFKLLKQLPNLCRIRLAYLRFDSFAPIDSASMQFTVLLPHLRDLFISDIPIPHAIIFDLLATSDHQIRRLSVGFTPARLAPPVTYRPLDFPGNLRFLSTGTEFYRTLADPRWNALEGLKGLGELQLQYIVPRPREDGEEREGGEEEELYRVIAPTLGTLVINSDDATWFARFLPLLTRLCRLSICGHPHLLDPAPLLLCLPASLSFLRLVADRMLHNLLVCWTATPSLVPKGLKQIQIDHIERFATYEEIPPVQTLLTTYRSNTLESLGRLAPSTLPFKTLEMFFYGGGLDQRKLDQRNLVEAECTRLGVIFRQPLKLWDD